MEATLQIEGMHCGACVSRVTKALEKAGAKPEDVQVGSARIEFDPAAVSLESVVNAMEKAGYPARKV
jgi:copper chaperone